MQLLTTAFQITNIAIVLTLLVVFILAVIALSKFLIKYIKGK